MLAGKMKFSIRSLCLLVTIFTVLFWNHNLRESHRGYDSLQRQTRTYGYPLTYQTQSYHSILRGRMSKGRLTYHVDSRGTEVAKESEPYEIEFFADRLACNLVYAILTSACWALLATLMAKATRRYFAFRNEMKWLDRLLAT